MKRTQRQRSTSTRIASLVVCCMLLVATGALRAQLPNAGTITGPSTVCANSSIILADANADTFLTIGKSYGGGKIGYILQSGNTGYDASRQKGIIAASADLGSFIWYTGNITTNATTWDIGAGPANTAILIDALGVGSYAVNEAVAYNGGGYTDWYLPSIEEMRVFYYNRGAIGGFSSSGYWSSTEYNPSGSIFFSFNNGTTSADFKNTAHSVRPARSFSEPAILSLTWSSSNTSVATVSNTGVVTGVATGTAVISYTVVNVNGSAVATATVTVPGVNAGAITGASSVCAGSNIQLENLTGDGNPSIGATYKGGIAGYFLQAGDAGYNPGVGKVLIVALTDQGGGKPWYSGAYSDIPGLSITVGAGLSQTNTIVAALGAGEYAATLARNYNGSGYSDWFLPTRGDLAKFASVREAANLAGQYWSSSQFDMMSAYAFDYTWNNYFQPNKRNYINVRAARINEVTALESGWTSSNTAVARITSLGVVTGVAPGTAVITYSVTSLTGCSAATTATITVLPVPAANAGGSVAAICQGTTTAALGGSFSGAATSAVWSDGGSGGIFANNAGSTPGAVNYTASSSSQSSVTLTLTTSGGSCGTVSAQKLLRVHPSLAITSIGNSGSVCEEGTLSLASTITGGSGGGTFAWSGPAGFSSADEDPIVSTSVTAAASGVYELIVADMYGCADTASTSVSIYPHQPITGEATVLFGQTTTLSNTVAGGAWSTATP